MFTNKCCWPIPSSEPQLTINWPSADTQSTPRLTFDPQQVESCLISHQCMSWGKLRQLLTEQLWSSVGPVLIWVLIECRGSTEGINQHSTEDAFSLHDPTNQSTDNSFISTYHVPGSLIELTRKLSIVDIKLNKWMAWRKSHGRQVCWEELTRLLWNVRIVMWVAVT